MTTRLFIGIAGGSCSGKGYLCNQLQAMLPPGKCWICSLDHYYRDLSHLTPEMRCRHNFDTPHAIDADLLLEQLLALRAGSRIEAPVYDFCTHTRLPERRQVSDDVEIVLVEGLFSLYWSWLRELLSLKVFVELDRKTCLYRRISRDIEERGRTRESVVRQFCDSVLPMQERYVIPTRRYADLIVRGNAPTHTASTRVLAIARSHAA